ncbi:glycosyltransferase family 4 protein [Ideonella livida]|uniref:glycosyltransferase family 4 protein n=1 Tax=Ideonella livida TaxID=2707176 RepID=UPI0028732ED0|nr:glycosyltransferase family 1 protein [Ideonella livida]
MTTTTLPHTAALLGPAPTPPGLAGAAPLDSDDLLVHPFAAVPRCLRVAVVTETYPPEVNGVATTLARVVEGLHQRGHEVQLLRPRPRQETPGAEPAEPRFHEVLMRGLPIPRYPGLRMGLPSKGALVRLWAQRRPDVVHIATEGPLGWSALQAALQLKLPVTSDFRTNFHQYSRHYGLGWLRKPIMAYLRKFHNSAQCTMVPTEALRADLQAAGFLRLAVVARGVDTALFTPERRSPALRAQWGVPPDGLVMACVGRLAAEKNLDLLLQAFDAVRLQRPHSRLLLVGDGPMRAALQARLDPGLILAGQRHGADLAAHYASADLFCFASQTETWGNVTAEALASGLPVLAFDHAAAGLLVHTGRNGVRVPAQAPGRFVQAAVELATAPPARRAALAQQARQDALALGWEGVLALFEAQLHRAVQRQALAGLRTAVAR